MTENDSGRVWLEDGMICYLSSVYGQWRVPISDVRVIGEYTNQDGPFADDYFFAFVTDPKVGWLEASFYAEGRESFLAALGEELGASLDCSLTGSTDFKSRVWWPGELAGQEMFEFRVRGWLDRLLLRNRQGLAPTVLDFCGRGEKAMK